MRNKVILAEILANSLILAFGIFAGLIFTGLWLGGGELWLGEDNKAILSLESLVALSIIAFAIWRTLNFIRRVK